MVNPIDGNFFEVCNPKKVVNDIRKFPKKDFDHVLKAQEFFLEVHERLGSLTKMGYLKRSGYDDTEEEVVEGVKAFLALLKGGSIS